MKVLFDTSVLNAALTTVHIHHAAAHAWLDRAQAGAVEWVVSSHTLAEVYATLTRMKLNPPVTAQSANQLIEDNIVAYARVRSLSGDEYSELLTQLSVRGLIGGVVYDGIIAHVARLESVDQLLTLNEKDFQRVYWDDPTKVVSPLSVGPP